MFAQLGQMVTRLRWTTIAGALVVVAIGATWGSGVFGALSDGGFEDPESESAQARSLIATEVGRQDIDVVAVYSSDSHTADDSIFASVVRQIADRVRDNDSVHQVHSYYNHGNAEIGPDPAAFVSTDRHSTYVAIQLDGDDDAARATAFETLQDELEPAVGSEIRAEIGGTSAIFSDINNQVKRDIVRAEMISLPIVFILALLIFGGLIAALMPLLVAGMAIVGAFLTTRLLTTVTDVSVFAINIITILGLGLAIDYSLFIVSRFREELAKAKRSSTKGASPADIRTAAITTVRTAGRTIAFSGITVALSLAGLLVFPQPFLRSMGYGGIGAVLFAVAVSVTVLPAVLTLLGDRINALRIPNLFRWRRRRSDQSVRINGPTEASQGVWARIARVVMRRPVLFSAGALVFLIVVALPFTHIEFGGVDERMLPEGTESRVVSERLDEEFPAVGATTMRVLVRGADVASAQSLAGEIAALRHVDDATIVRGNGDSTLITATYSGQATDSEAREIVTDIRALNPPTDAQVMVAGQTAQLVDLLDSVAKRMPWMVALIASVTLILLFVAFGSIILPVKAVLMNVVSLGASFGAVVWIFQDGHLSDVLGFTPTGFIEATQPILMVAILFGLSTDYELFLLSRIREQWDATKDNTVAVATGLQRTGGIITSAALLLVIVVAGFAAGGITMIKMIGVGMVVAIIVDATIVRALLVPATMRLLGRWNWWLPKPLARWDTRRRAAKPAT